MLSVLILCCFVFNDTATTEIFTDCHTLSLHDSLPIYRRDPGLRRDDGRNKLLPQPNHRQWRAIGVSPFMAGAAIAEIILGQGIGVLPADGNSRDARRSEPRGDIGGDVEHRMAGLARGEEAFVRGVVGEEVLNEAVIDLVGGAPDARTERGGDMGAAGAAAFPTAPRARKRVVWGERGADRVTSG